MTKKSDLPPEAEEVLDEVGEKEKRRLPINSSRSRLNNRTVTTMPLTLQGAYSTPRTGSYTPTSRSMDAARPGRFAPRGFAVGLRSDFSRQPMVPRALKHCNRR